MALLYQMWVDFPSPDQLKEWHDKNRYAPIIRKEDEENFKRLGYTKESIERMKDELTKAGYVQD